MREMTAGQRLREARTAARLTRKQLAGALRKAESTIRAHENGQNAISSEVALDYAVELGVSPTWLLYGKEEPPSHPTLPVAISGKIIPVLGTLRYGSFTRQDMTEQLGELLVHLPGYEKDNLAAFLDGDTSDRLAKEYVFLTSGGGLTAVNEFVLERTQGGLIERAIWRSLWQDQQLIFYVGDSLSTARERITQKPGEALGGVNVLGRVIGRLSYRVSP